MASSSAPVRPARYLSVFLVLLIGVYLLVFLTGDKQARPKLGIDLQGGTRVTLTARTPDGSRPSRDSLAQAQQIISARVNGLGVSGSEVVVDGDNLVITVPGNDGNEARNLGQTARLYIRPVIQAVPAQNPQEPKPEPQQPAAPPAGRPAPRRPVPDRARVSRRRPAGQPAPPPPPGQPAPQPRPYPEDPTPAPSPAPSPAPARAQPADRRRRRPGSRRRVSRRPMCPHPRIRARISPSASPQRRSGGRAPARASSSSPCNTRPPCAAKTTSWPATTTRPCPWSPARRTTRPPTCWGRRSSAATRSRTRRRA